MFVETQLIRGFDVVASLFDLIGSHGFICGGYARYCASPTVSPAKAEDVDVYAYTEDDFQTIRERLVLNLKIKVETNRAITFVTSIEGGLAFTPTVQLIKPVKKFRMVTVGDQREVISNFDFTIVRACIMNPSVVLVDSDFHLDEMERRLRLRNIHCPISSTLRCIKYVERGYSLAPWDCLSLFLDWDGRDADYRKELIEGLAEVQKAMETKKPLTQERLTAIYDLINVD